MELLFSTTWCACLSTWVCIFSCCDRFRECIALYFILTEEPQAPYWRLRPSFAIIYSLHCLFLLNVHKQDDKIHSFHIYSYAVWCAVNINAMKNYHILPYLLALITIRGDGVNGSSSTLKVMLLNKTSRTAVKWSQYIKSLPITITIHLLRFPLSVLLLKIWCNEGGEEDVLAVWAESGTRWPSFNGCRCNNSNNDDRKRRKLSSCIHLKGRENDL